MWLYEIYKLLVYIVDSILTYLELGLYVIYTYIYCLTVAQSFHSLVCQSHWHKKQMTSKCNPQLRHLLRSIPVTQTFYSQALPLKKDRWIKDRGRGVLMNEA